MTPIRRALALAALALLAGVGCVPQGPNLAPWLFVDPDPEVAATQERVVVIGDSLTAWAEADAKIAWATTDSAVSYQAFGGTQWQHWYKRFEKIPAGSTVEVLLGTNDIGNLSLHQATWNTLAGLEVLDQRRPACVVTFLLNTTSASYRPADIRAKVAGYNAWLTELVESGRYPWLGLYDWRADSAGHPEYLLIAQGDPVHHTDDNDPATMDGNQAYVEAQLRGPTACPATPALPG